MSSPTKPALILGGLALLLGVIVLVFSRTHPAPVSASPPPDPRPTPSTVARPAMMAETRASAPPPAEESPVPAPVISITEQVVDPAAEEQKFAVLEALHEAASTYSPEGIPLIEPSLYSSDREIREAAADAMVVLGETAGAAVLRKAAAKARDPREAVALIEKAEYLELPPGRLLLREKKSTPGRTPTTRPPRTPSR